MKNFTKFSLKISLGLIVVLVLSFPFVVSAQEVSSPGRKRAPDELSVPVPATTTIIPKPKPKPAATTPTNTSDTQVDYWGCDALQAQIDANGGGRAGELPKYCSEGEVYKKIVYWLYYILGIGAVIMLIYGGYIYMTAGSSETQTKKGKNIIMYTLAGIAIGIIATAIVTIVVNLIVDNKLF